MTHDTHRDAPETLPASTKFVYSIGDHTVNLVLSAASLLFFKFLTDVAELRPVLAGAVVVTTLLSTLTLPAWRAVLL